MKTWCVIFAISIILASLSVGEGAVSKHFCSEIEKNAVKISDNLEKDIVNFEDIEKVDNVWSKYKTAVFAFANHNMFSEYEECISDMYYSYEFNLKDRLNYTVYRLIEVNKRLKEAVSFSIANIF